MAAVRELAIRDLPLRDLPIRDLALRDLPLRDLAALAAPVSMAGEQRLPVLAALEPLFPSGGLRRGSVVAVEGSQTTSLALALAAAASAEGSWCAAVGRPALGLVAAAELGIVLERFALVPAPAAGAGPGGWAWVVATMLDAFDLVLAWAPPHAVRRCGRPTPAGWRGGRGSGGQSSWSAGRARRPAGPRRPTSGWPSPAPNGTGWREATGGSGDGWSRWSPAVGARRPAVAVPSCGCRRRKEGSSWPRPPRRLPPSTSRPARR